MAPSPTLETNKGLNEFVHSNGKTFAHLQMDIFCHLNFVIIEEMASG
jgi:hypothetical protein